MTKLNHQDRVAVGYALYDAGFPCSWSTDVMDALIAGFGDFHKDGDFEYPVYVESGKVANWVDVKRYLKIEEALDQAQDVFAGFEDLNIHDGQFITFEGEYYKARYEGPDLFSFTKVDGTCGLQNDEGRNHLSIEEWNDCFVFDKVNVFEQDE